MRISSAALSRRQPAPVHGGKTMRPLVTATLEGGATMWTAGDEPVVHAIRVLRPGHWPASEGELIDGVLVMRPIRRRRRCCGDELYLITEVRHATYRAFTLSLRRCSHCERS